MAVGAVGVKEPLPAFHALQLFSSNGNQYAEGHIWGSMSEPLSMTNLHGSIH